jgi:hypothetical protein
MITHEIQKVRGVFLQLFLAGFEPGFGMLVVTLDKLPELVVSKCHSLDVMTRTCSLQKW